MSIKIHCEWCDAVIPEDTDKVPGIRIEKLIFYPEKYQGNGYGSSRWSNRDFCCVDHLHEWIEAELRRLEEKALKK